MASRSKREWFSLYGRTSSDTGGFIYLPGSRQRKVVPKWFQDASNPVRMALHSVGQRLKNHGDVSEFERRRIEAELADLQRQAESLLDRMRAQSAPQQILAGWREQGAHGFDKER